MAQNNNAILLHKSVNTLLPTRYVFTIYETFQWGTAWKEPIQVNIEMPKSSNSSNG